MDNKFDWTKSTEALYKKGQNLECKQFLPNVSKVFLILMGKTCVHNIDNNENWQQFYQRLFITLLQLA